MSEQDQAIPAASKARGGDRRGHGLLWGLALAGLCAMPALLSGYELFQLANLLVVLLAVHALNILAGTSGQISLGNGAFFAIGAYTYAILFQTMGTNHLLALVAALVLSGVAGLCIGFPSLRLEGKYLALATYAVAVATPQLLRFSGLEPLTHGSEGILLDLPEPPLGLDMSSSTYLFYLVAVVTVALLWLGNNLTRGNFGRALIGLRDNSLAAMSTGGIDVATKKVQVFVVTAGITGVAGALSAMLTQFVSPDNFSIFVSITFLVAVVIGGLGAMLGSVIGALFVHFVPDMIDQFSHTATGVVFGGVVILCMVFAPEGIAGLLHKLRQAATGLLGSSK